MALRSCGRFAVFASIFVASSLHVACAQVTPPPGVESLTFPLDGSDGTDIAGTHVGALSSSLLSASGMSRPPAGGINPQLSGTDYADCDATADAPPPEIIALAASLKNNWNNIFQYVNNTIDLEPEGESRKGALGTYLDQSGTSFDQSSLLVALLRAAGYQAQFLIGRATLTTTQMGLNSIPSQLILDAGGNTSGTIPYAWVQVYINGVWKALDPANKSYSILSGTNLNQWLGTATPTGYTPGGIATMAGTNGAEKIYNANKSGGTQNYASMTSFAGGRRIASNFTTVVSNRTGGTAYNYLPTGSSSQFYRVGLSFQYTPAGQSSPTVSSGYLCLDQIYGHDIKMSNGTLSVDGLTIATSFQDPVNITVWHPGDTTWSQGVYETMASTDALIAMSAGRFGQFHAQHDAAIYNNIGNTGLVPQNSDQALMAASSSQLSQTSQSINLLDQLAGTYTINHHTLQLLRTNSTVDTPLTSISTDTVNSAPPSGLTVSPKAVAYALSAVQSAQEAVALGQAGANQPISAATLLGNLSSSGAVAFTSHTGTLPSLPNYSTSQASELSAYHAAGYDLVFPSSGPGSTAPLGFLAITSTGTSAFVLDTPSGIYKGAEDLSPTAGLGVIGMGGIASEGGPTSNGVAVNRATGEVTFKAPLISIGSSGSPFKLEFDLLYSSRSDMFPASTRPDAYGYAHNLEMRATTSSDGLTLIGSNNLTGAGLPGLVTAYDLLETSNALVTYYTSGGSFPLNQTYETAGLAAWLAGQGTNNVVTISQGASNSVFAKMPDGTWQTPSPSALSLTQTGGAYTLTSAHKDTLKFNSSDGQIATITTPGGVQTSFAYTPSSTTPSYNLLHTVTVGAHSLTFYYTNSQISPSVNSPKLTKVQDETGRKAVLTYSDDGLEYIDKPDYVSGQHSLTVGPNANTIGPTTTGPTGTSIPSVTYPLTHVYDSLGYLTQVAYDYRNFPTTVTDANSNTTTYAINGARSEVDDAIGNASYTNSYAAVFDGDWINVDSYDPLGGLTSQTFNYAGQLITKRLPDYVNASSSAWSYTYDSRGNPQTSSFGTSTSALTATTIWDPTWNKPHTVTDPQGNTTTYDYDVNNGNLLYVIQPQVPCNPGTTNCTNGLVTPTTTYTYWSNGGGGYTPLVETATAPDGEVTSYTYDFAGSTWNPLSMVVDSGTGHLNITTSVKYDSVGNVNSVTTPNGNTTTATYDAARRLKTKINPPLAWFQNTKLETIYTYDANGRLTETQQQTGGTPAYLTGKMTYDPVGNMLTSITPTTGSGTLTTTYTPDADERISVVVDPAGNTTTKTYDADSRPWKVLQVINGTNTVMQTTTYNGDSLPYQVIDGNGHAITYGYDPFDRLTSTTYADGTSEQLTLNNDGQVTQLVDRSGNTFVYTLDALNRETSETDTPSATGQSGYSKSFAYDAASRTVVLNGTGGNFTFAYDTAGRQSQTSFAGISGIGDEPYTVGFTYDGDGNTQTITYPDGYIYTYGYDSIDEMLTVGETAPGTSTVNNMVTYSWNTLGALTNAAFANGTSTAYSGYDQYNHLTQITQTVSNAPLTINYTLDNDERRSEDSFSDSSFVWHPAAAGTVPYVPNSLNQYSSINNQPLGYSANGTLTSDGSAPLGAATYGWDMFNRLTTVQNSQHSATYYYDTLGRRTHKAVDGGANSFAYEGNHIIMEYGSSALPGSAQRAWIYGVGNTPFAQEGFTAGVVTSTSYLHADALGTVLQASNSAGKQGGGALPTSPWGEVNTTTSVPFRFAGMFLDPETLLYYDHARYYSPAQGRFISPDPISVKGGVDLYAYAGNDPINGVDTSGLDGPGSLEFAAETVDGSDSSYANSSEQITVSGQSFDFADQEAELARLLSFGGDACANQGNSCSWDGTTLTLNRQSGPTDPDASVSGGGGFGAIAGRGDAPSEAGPPVPKPQRQSPQSVQHQYDDAYKVCKQGGNCTAQNVYKCLAENPAPGVSGPPAQNGSVGNVLGLGPVSITVSPSTMTIVNSTLPAHMLYPGYVIRSVVTDSSGNIGVSNSGYGTGQLGALNSALAPWVWSWQTTLQISSCVAGGK
jgi:RHS repeat-associated protein